MEVNRIRDFGPVAYCTLVLNDAYVTASLVLAKSLLDTGTTLPIVVLIDPENVSPASQTGLLTLFTKIVPVPPVAGVSSDNLALIGRPDLHATLAKLHVWSLADYSRVLYLDADTLVLPGPSSSPGPTGAPLPSRRGADRRRRPRLDHLLLDIPSWVRFAASPEVGFPDCFNSGVMLLTPDGGVHSALLRFAAERESFDGGDQGLLNEFFGDGTRGHPVRALLGNRSGDVGVDKERSNSGADSAIMLDDDDAEASGASSTSGSAGSIERAAQPPPLPGTDDASWYRLSFTYNMEMHRVYRLYIPAALRYRDEHKVLHFIGKDKPWHFPDGKVSLEGEEGVPVSPYFSFYAEMVGRWWDVRRSLPAEAVA